LRLKEYGGLRARAPSGSIRRAHESESRVPRAGAAPSSFSGRTTTRGSPRAPVFSKVLAASARAGDVEDCVFVSIGPVQMVSRYIRDGNLFRDNSAGNWDYSRATMESMKLSVNRRIVLAARPEGDPKDSDFRIEEVDIPSPGDTQVLLRNLYLSLDPYMRGRMNAGPSYAAPVELNGVMEGGTVSEVVESKSPSLNAGDIVLSYTGWQEYAVVPANMVRKVDLNVAPVSTALGVLGMPGMTAYTGLLNIGQPKEGETVVVAAAAGAVGSAVGQIAKIKGCRAVGIAGGPKKCDYVRSELGFDACIDHRSASFADELKAACPNGVDVYFENVGGVVLKAVVPLLNNFARVPVCGLIAQYNMSALPSGPDWSPVLMASALIKRLTIRGFIVSDFDVQRGEFYRNMSSWFREGRIRHREDVVDGIENVVGAFQGLLRGQNFGKLLVRLGR
jgi:NADPH-dependent curcumin reductase CurA